MRIRYKIISSLLCFSILLCFCSSCGEAPIWDEDDHVYLYRGNRYDGIPIDLNTTQWLPLPSKRILDKVGATPLSDFPWHFRPIYATRETSPCFLLIDWRDDADAFPDIAEVYLRAYLREDIVLSPVRETPFSSVEVVCREQGERSFYDTGIQSATFYDLVEPNVSPFVLAITAQEEWICTLRCSHSEIPYLFCSFGVCLYEGEYYLSFDEAIDKTSYQTLAYPLRSEICEVILADLPSE